MQDSIFSSYRVNPVNSINNISGFGQKQYHIEDKTTIIDRLAHRVKNLMYSYRFDTNNIVNVESVAREVYREFYNVSNGEIANRIGSESSAVSEIITRYRTITSK